MISISMAMAGAMATHAGSAGAPIAPALVAADAVFAPIGYGLVTFVVLVLGALLGGVFADRRPRRVVRVPLRPMLGAAAG
jgi:hypothetical protein